MLLSLSLSLSLSLNIPPKSLQYSWSHQREEIILLQVRKPQHDPKPIFLKADV
jgi:hypothetical protein